MSEISDERVFTINLNFENTLDTIEIKPQPVETYTFLEAIYKLQNHECLGIFPLNPNEIHPCWEPGFFVGFNSYGIGDTPDKFCVYKYNPEKSGDRSILSYNESCSEYWGVLVLNPIVVHAKWQLITDQNLACYFMKTSDLPAPYMTTVGIGSVVATLTERTNLIAYPTQKSFQQADDKNFHRSILFSSENLNALFMANNRTVTKSAPFIYMDECLSIGEAVATWAKHPIDYPEGYIPSKYGSINYIVNHVKKLNSFYIYPEMSQMTFDLYTIKSMMKYWNNSFAKQLKTCIKKEFEDGEE